MALVAKSLTAKFKNFGSHCSFTIHLIFPTATKFYVAISQGGKVFTRKKLHPEDIYLTDTVQRGSFCMKNPGMS